jgi:hypothetical protein
MRIIEVAEAELAKGVREIGGKNRGPDVEKYQKAVAIKPGDPWCAAFVSWCYLTATGLPSASWCSGSAITIFHKGSRKAAPSDVVYPSNSDLPTRVRPGMVWVRAKDPEGAASAAKGVWVQGHTGIVVAVDATGFTCIEGNTNDAGSREGDGVYRKLHKWGGVDVARTVGWFAPAPAAAPTMPAV